MTKKKPPTASGTNRALTSNLRIATNSFDKAAPMRRKCETCQTPFRPNRSDAEFCSGLCRQAAYRIRKRKIEEENSIKAVRQIAKNTHDAAHLYETYVVFARMLGLQAERNGIRHVKFMGTPRGILVVEDTPLDAWLQCDPLRLLDGLDMTEHRSNDPEVIEAIGQPGAWGWSLMQMQYQKECRDMLWAERPVLLFRVGCYG